MKNMKKAVALLLTLALALGLCSFASAEELTETVQLGGTPYVISVPQGLAEVGITDLEVTYDGLIAYYTSPDTDLTINVYAYDVMDEADSLIDFTNSDAATYAGWDIVTDIDINGTPVTSYRWTPEATDGAERTGLCYSFRSGDVFMQADFTWADPAGEALAREIIATLTKTELRQVLLGFSPYAFTLPEGFVPGEIDEEDIASGLVQYYWNNGTELDFDVYQLLNPEEITLPEAAEANCAAENGYGMTDEIVINGVNVVNYYADSEYEGVDYVTSVCMFNDEKGGFTKVVFWLDTYLDYVQADTVLQTLAPYEPAFDMGTEPMLMQIGSSEYAVTLPTGFYPGKVLSEEYTIEGEIGTFYSAFTDLCVDIYQFGRADREPTLALFTESDAAAYNGTDIRLDDVINGLNVTSYHSLETYDDVTYEYMNYSFEDAYNYYQICFEWLPGDEASKQQALEAIKTIAPYETKAVALFDSPYTVSLGTDYLSEDVELGNDDQAMTIFYRERGDCAVLSAYSMTNAEAHMGLTEYAKAECAFYTGAEEIIEAEVNGVPVAFFHYSYESETPDASMFGVLVYVLENGENGYIELDFVVDDYLNAARASRIASTIAKAA